ALGYNWWNRGIMTEALTALIEYLFDTGFNRIAAIHRVENPASGRVMEKSGMQYEGLIRQIITDGAGGFHDAQQYAIVAADRGKPLG
ncbi:MAG: GNAT family N-acetyltransferase, partial [Coriobacteriia bacterium]|nr:GNAT family N-acetyltransferase [Coriobacteriia bacterium]